jgi:hypothetical protein
MLPWNNLFLIPLVLIGSLFAFFFGRTIVGGLIRAFGRATAHKPAQPKAPAILSTYSEEPPPRPRRTMELPQRQKSMADRYEEIGEELLSLEDAQEQQFLNLVALDKRKERMDRAMSAARRQAGDNALKGAYVDNRSGANSPNS